MPEDNGSHTNSNVGFEAAPMRCGNCGQVCPQLTIEQVDGQAQLRVGIYLISKIEANCTHCGRRLLWNINEKELQKMSQAYGDVLRKLNGGYTPE